MQLVALRKQKPTYLLIASGRRSMPPGGCLNPFPAQLIYLNVYPLEVVSRYRDPQLQVGENYSCLFNLSNILCKY